MGIEWSENKFIGNRISPISVWFLNFFLHLSSYNMPPSNRNNFALTNWFFSKQTASFGIAYSYFGLYRTI